MSGNYTAEFEHWLARKNRSKFAITCHSGTQALEIIAEFYRQHWPCDPGHTPTVVMPSISYVATANAFVRARWDIRFADVDAHGMLSLKDVPNDSLTHWNAICLVGLYGQSVYQYSDTQFWKSVRYKNQIVIEDGAQHWLSAGSSRIGHATAISFDPTKNLGNYGNGGAVVTDDEDLATFARAWCANGKPYYRQPGTNSRMSEIDCAQMLVKVNHLDQWQVRRRHITEYWYSRLAGKRQVRSLADLSNMDTHCFHKFVIDADHRNDLQRHLKEHGIETRVHYDQALFEHAGLSQFINPGVLSSAASLCRRVLSLPLYPELTDLEVDYIIDQVIDFSS
jgi:dTDP-4-amino-4,6-dideoxygalactose transaminase